MNKTLAVLAAATLLAGCGTQGAPATAVGAQAAQANAQNFFNRLPKDRALTAEENELDFDGFRALATAEVLKRYKTAQLTNAFCLDVDDKGHRTIDAAVHFYFDTPNFSGLHVTVRGATLHFSQAVFNLDALIDGAGPVQATKLTAVDAIKVAREKSGATNPRLVVYLSQPRGFSHPVYTINAIKWGLLEQFRRIDAVTGAVLTGPVAPSLVEELAKADRE